MSGAGQPLDIATPQPPPKPVLTSIIANDPNKQLTTPVNPVAGVSAPTLDTVQSGISSSTDTLNALLKIRNEQFDATIDSARKNSAVAQQLGIETQGIYKSVTDAYDNITKAEGLPGGATGGIAKLIGLFDSDYNAAKQKTIIDSGQVKLEATKNRAETQMAINNALPSILQQEADLLKTNYDARVDANKLALQVYSAKQEDERIHLEKIKALTMLDADKRDQFKFQVAGMSLEQKQDALAQAQQGKGPFAKFGAGYLQAEITQEESASAALQKARDEAARGHITAMNDAMQDFANKLPPEQLLPLIEQAQKAGQSVITLGQGKDQVQLPVAFALNAISYNADIRDKATAHAAADLTDSFQIPAKLNNIATAAAAFSSVDPQAAAVLQHLAQARGLVDPKNPFSVKEFSALLDAQVSVIQSIAKKTAATMNTKDAQAAVEEYGDKGQFSAHGGAAVVADTAGTPALSMQTKYTQAFGFIQTKIAERLKNQNLQGMPQVDTNNLSDVQMMMNAALQNKSLGRERINQIAQEVLADPGNIKTIGGMINAKIKPDIVNTALQELSSAKGAPAIWAELANRHGVFDTAAIMGELEKRSVESGYKINYGRALIDAVRRVGTESDTSAIADPRYTLYDHALEAAIYGGKPYRAAVQDQMQDLIITQQRAHDEMKQRIQDDLSGKTQQQARGLATTAAAAKEGRLNELIQSPSEQEAPEEFNPRVVPSATGTKLTAEEVRRMYRGGAP